MADAPTPVVDDPTDVGSYFVATYPPFSVWTSEAVQQDALPALQARSPPGVPLGVYLHIPFCRKRCHFCYFRVYTDKNAQEVGAYLDVLAREWELYSRLPVFAERPHRLRLLRRRHAVVSLDGPARRPGEPAHRRHALA